VAVGLASAALVELYGSTRTKEALASLLLWQGCAARAFLLRAFLSAAERSDRQAALLRLWEGEGPAGEEHRRLLAAFLREACPAWRRLDCSAKAAEVMERLPAGVFVLCVQLDPAGEVMYAGGVGAGGAGACVARMAWGEEQRAALLGLQGRMAAFRRDATKHLLVYGDEAGVYGDLLAPDPASSPAAVGGEAPGAAKAGSAKVEAPPTGGNSSADIGPIPEFPDPLEAELAAVVEGLGALLRPLLEAPGVKGLITAAAQAPKGALVLLLDEKLLPLPLEALAAFAQVKGISRDFSLHMLQHRLALAKEIAAGASRLRWSVLIVFPDVSSTCFIYVASHIPHATTIVLTPPLLTPRHPSAHRSPPPPARRQGRTGGEERRRGVHR
jgi:hypothetical protein